MYASALDFIEHSAINAEIGGMVHSPEYSELVFGARRYRSAHREGFCLLGKGQCGTADATGCLLSQYFKRNGALK